MTISFCDSIVVRRGWRTTLTVAFIAALGLLGAPGATASAAPTKTRATVAAGPMAGYASLREAGLWVQLTASARVRFVYWDSAAPGEKFTTREVDAMADSAFVVHAVADRVREDRTYYYDVLVDGVRATLGRTLRFRTPPRENGAFGVRDIRFAFGSCANIADPAADAPGNSNAGDYGIFEAIADQAPHVMLWGGDNVYFRDIDWSSKSGMVARYTHDRALPALQRLLGSTNNYATWDDHDYGPNDVDRSWIGSDWARSAFRQFWFNPGYGMPQAPLSIGTSFRWGDVEVFLMDDRSYRAPNMRVGGDGAYWGEGQLQWLLDGLRTSTATFKLVVNGGQVLSPLPLFENFVNYPVERDRLLTTLAHDRTEGVVFLSGDRHITELTRMPRAGMYPLYDATISPLTSGAGGGKGEEPNPWRVQGTWTTVRNFATLDVTGPRNDRVLTITVRDAKGALLWTHVIPHKQLRIPLAG